MKIKPFRRSSLGVGGEYLLSQVHQLFISSSLSLVSVLSFLDSLLSSLVSRLSFLVSLLSSLVSRLSSLVSRLSSLVYLISSLVSLLSSLLSRCFLFRFSFVSLFLSFSSFPSSTPSPSGSFTLSFFSPTSSARSALLVLLCAARPWLRLREGADESKSEGEEVGKMKEKMRGV